MMNEMSLQQLIKELCCRMVLLSFLWSASEGMILAASYPAIVGSEPGPSGSRNQDAFSSLHQKTTALRSSVSNSLPSFAPVIHPSNVPTATNILSSELRIQSSDSFHDVEFNSTLSLEGSMVEDDNLTLLDGTDRADLSMPSATLASEVSQRTNYEADLAHVPMPSVTLASEKSQRKLTEADSTHVPMSLVTLASEKSQRKLTEADTTHVLMPSLTLASETSQRTPYEADSTRVPMPSVTLASEKSQRELTEADSTHAPMPSVTLASRGMSSGSQPLAAEVHSLNIISPFHTPLMSLLVAPEQLLHSTSVAQQLAPTTSANNEAPSSLLPVPTEQPQVSSKKLLMLVLRAEDCSRFSKQDFERMLAKLMTRFGFADAVPEVSTARCYSHLSLNLTVDGPNPTLRFNNLTSGSNFTVDVLNRTFRIVKFEKVDLRLERFRPRNKSSTVQLVDNNVVGSYTFIGFIFGTVAIFLAATACRWYYYRSYQKRLGTHTRLRPEDYTLTPIPRLNNAYCRAPNRASVFSTASAAEQGVVQPFDTSIVPLEDSSNSRGPTVESVPAKSGLKTLDLDVQNFPGKSSNRACKKVEFNTGGVANPTFQRY